MRDAHARSRAERPLADLWRVLHRDLERYGDGVSLGSLVKHYVVTPGYRYTFWMRVAAAFKRAGRAWTLLYAGSRFMVRRCRYRYGIDIPYNTRVGPGLYIGHCGGIVVHHAAVIGENCNINHGVTIGATYRGQHQGVPVLGDRVYLGPGCKVIGAVHVGNDAAIGANAVVTRAVPDGAVMVGVPAEMISTRGSAEYIAHAGGSARQ